MPLFYVGWSDSVLSPSEMTFIHNKIQDLDFLEEDERAYLIKWTDPQSPPPKYVFNYWLNTMKKHCVDLTYEDKRDLISIGLSMARKASLSHSFDVSDQGHQAVFDIADALGVETPDTFFRFLRDLGIEDGQPKTQSASFNIEEMRTFLDGRHRALRDKMRSLLQDPVFVSHQYRDRHHHRDEVLKRLSFLAGQGVNLMSVPEEYGGQARKEDQLIVFEMLSYGDLSLTVKFGVQFGLFGGAILLLGTEKHHRQYLNLLHEAKLLGCFAMTETGHGSDVKGLETTATYLPSTKEIEIHTPHFGAGKEYIGNALHAEMAVVFAQLIVGGENKGVHAILAPMRNEEGKVVKGVEVMDCGEKMGLNGVDNGRIWFTNLKVPVGNLLDRYGSIDENGQYQSPIANGSKRFFTMLGALVVGRISVGLSGVACSKKALAIAVKYAFKRRQFESRKGQETLIMDYPSHQKRLFPLVSETIALSFTLQKLNQQYAAASDEDYRKIETLAAGLKAKATWLCTKTIQTCREACGGKGYLSENQLAALKADSEIFTTFEGDNTVLMQLVAKGVLTEFRQNFHDSGSIAVIRFIMGKLNLKMKEFKALEKRNTNKDHLMSEEFLKDAFDFRYQKTLFTLADRMRKFVQRKVDGHDIFLNTQLHMIDLADAYIDKITMEAFFEAVDQSPEGSVRKALRTQCVFYGLHKIYEHRGWYLETDYMEGNKSKAIRGHMNKMMKDHKSDLLAWVDSFGIPDQLIQAPIAISNSSNNKV